MIQKTSQRQLNAALGTLARPEEWGQWIQDRHYSLEVTQHPVRARMCGFGDKDRRPLAPAAVAKMIVRGDDNTILDVDDIDVDFFVVTVDLWSADGMQEMNLVLHPSSADRYVPQHQSKPRKKSGPGPPAPTPSRSSRPSPYPPPTERPRGNFNLRPIEPTPSGTTPLLTPASTPSFAAAYPFPPQPDPFAPSPADASSPWSASFQAPSLPSIHSLGRNSPASTPFDPTSPDLSAFRAWNDASLFDPDTRWSAEPFAIPTLPTTTTTSTPVPAPAPAPAPVPDDWSPLFATPVPAVQQQAQHTIPPLPRHTYTRTLVGPLCANAQRLQDEHRKPGIFFLFQDLSIRTEGSFRLRMRLMNVGTPPAPNSVSNSVHTSITPVLAQVFTEPFTVYSAKRFPGVPDTTALSIAFGNQGQKLPLRNRHGPSKQQRRPRRPGMDSSDDDSS